MAAPDRGHLHGAGLEDRLDAPIPHWRWSAPSAPGAGAIFTTREGGVSDPPWDECNLGMHVGDEVACVQENRYRIASLARLHAHDVAHVRQVHGADTWLELASVAGQGPAGPAPDEVSWTLDAAVEADALATRATGRGIAVMVADCVPVALAVGTSIAVVHAGWRGIAAGVVQRALDTLERWEAQAMATGATVSAALGPAIGACCYEVDEDVARQVSEAAPGAPDRHDAAAVVVERDGPGGRCRIDLHAAVVRQLEAGGVPADDVARVELCTACTPARLYSHRGEQGRTGRQGVLAWRASGD